MAIAAKAHNPPRVMAVPLKTRDPTKFPWPRVTNAPDIGVPVRVLFLANAE